MIESGLSDLITGDEQRGIQAAMAIAYPSNRCPTSRRSSGFVLWEIMLALTIFSIVAVSLASALYQTVDASIMLRDASQVRIELQNILAEATTQKLKVGKSDVQEGDGRIAYEREVRSVVAKTAKGDPVLNLYKIVVRAYWRSAGQDRSEQADVIVYQP